MNPLVQLKQTAPVFFVVLLLQCFGFLTAAQAVLPPPDGGYPGFNTAEGTNALFSLTTGTANTAVGWFSLRLDTDGSFNTAIGAGTLASVTTASRNTAAGVAALLLNTTGSGNTAVGVTALLNNTESNNTAIGDSALFSNTIGNVNTAVGVEALNRNTTGNINTAVGAAALKENTAGFSNTATGRSALFSNNGSGNTAIGDLAGADLTIGNGNVCIGANVVGIAGESTTTRIRNIGSTPIVGGINVVVDGTGGIGDQKLGYASSSWRYKGEIKPMDQASETLFALKPVTFRAKGNMNPARVKHYGLIAEDVAAVNPDLVVYNAEGKPETLRFDSINAMLLNEFLKEYRKNKEQEVTIAELKAGMEALTTRVKAQASQIQKVSAQLEVSKIVPPLVQKTQ